jgi:thimet oligopeptidase
MTELSLNRELYEAFVALDTSKMDANTKRLVEHAIRDFKRAGVDKDEATRKRIREIKDELTMVGQQFQKTIADDTRTESFKPEELEGLPEDFIKAHPKQPDGTIKLTTNYPDYIPFIQYAKDHEAKKRLYIQFRSRGGEINEKNLRKILKLRAELATLLGYPNWADYVTEDKMMKSGANAAKFIKRVVRVAQKRAKKDYRELLKAKRKEVKGAKRVEDYEKSYYENKVKTDKYAFDPQTVRPYFEYEQTEKGLLQITSKIYGIEYKPVDPKEAKVWHPSVKAFDVMKDGKKIGRIYLDMHPREGKYKHAAQFTKQSGVDGVQLPEGVLVCNFPDPAKGKALMEHDDVTTMFHEFGHLMHHIFGGQGKKWIDQSGVATEWDFVEAPSQMFEEWAWSHDTLKLFAKHHETGEVIPKDMVDKMRRAKKFGLGVQTLQQMFYASISLEFYRNDPDKLDMLGMVKKLQKKYTPFRYVDGTRFHASFGHLYGYSAQYYTYMWSLVIAKDLLTPFKKHGLMNTDWTYKYRDVILGQGGTKDAAVLVEEFLGRPFNYKAFEKFLGG